MSDVKMTQQYLNTSPKHWRFFFPCTFRSTSKTEESSEIREILEKEWFESFQTDPHEL